MRISADTDSRFASIGHRYEKARFDLCMETEFVFAD
jgi:hypothetical protein